MEYIQKLPFILTVLMAFIIGGVSYASGVEKNDIYVRMLIGAVAFLFVGLYARHVLVSLYEEIEEKRMEILKAENEKNASKIAETNSGSSIDYRIDDISDVNNKFEEEFSPLTVSEVIRTKIKDD